MEAFLKELVFSFGVTGPIFLMLVLGIGLKRYRFIDQPFVETGTKLVFNVTLPALLFLSVIRTDMSALADANLIVFSVLANIVMFFVFGLCAKLVPQQDRGVVIQGAFRSNAGIIGLALVANTYGTEGIAIGSLYVAAITILYNILATLALSQGQVGVSPWQVIRTIAKNPLIISLVLALPISWLRVPIPEVFIKTGSYLANVTLPLALLCTGATLNLKQAKDQRFAAIYSSAGKLIIMPTAVVLVAIPLGFREMSLGVLFLMSAAPTAAASYVMARAMGGNATLAANIIAITTLGSILTCSAGITVLRSLGMM